MSDMDYFTELADKIEAEKPYGCSVMRHNNTLHFSFGIPKEDQISRSDSSLFALPDQSDNQEPATVSQSNGSGVKLDMQKGNG
jgi:hypothetical protein